MDYGSISWFFFPVSILPYLWQNILFFGAFNLHMSMQELRKVKAYGGVKARNLWYLTFYWWLQNLHNTPPSPGPEDNTQIPDLLLSHRGGALGTPALQSPRPLAPHSPPLWPCRSLGRAGHPWERRIRPPALRTLPPAGTPGTPRPLHVALGNLLERGWRGARNGTGRWHGPHTESAVGQHPSFSRPEPAPGRDVERGGIRYREEVDCIIFIV